MEPPQLSNTTDVAAAAGQKSAVQVAVAPVDSPQDSTDSPTAQAVVLKTATFGNGCFWCTEAVFEALKGVRDVESGYSGGFVKNPTYEQIGSKSTGHAEVIQLKYDPSVISYEVLLQVFWKTHDPTTPNQQGFDVGPQYRSAVFFHDKEQQASAQKVKKQLDAAGEFAAPIVTEITKFSNYYSAEDDHQDFYELNRYYPYCQANIPKKMAQLRYHFKEYLK
jgi:peptide-methionine (S)-S-oxide reductase